MDFGIYPPEINSGRMFAGPGSGPMLAAAQAWAALADELYATATSYHSVADELTSGTWSGPSATSMNAAATSYTEWLSATAAQAEETASRATAAAAAYDAAFASTVPPPEIAANRSLLATLVATNFLGINTPAIAATEALYAEMWAQDALAMYTYAGTSASATTLTPFSSPTPNTTPSSNTGQSAAVSQATSASAGSAQDVFSVLQQALSAVPNTLQSAAAAPTASTTPLDVLNLLSELVTIFVGVPGAFANIPDVGLSVLAIVDLPFGVGGTVIGFHTDDILSDWNGEEKQPFTGPAPVKGLPATLADLRPGTLPQSSLTANLGAANSVGKLSVPRGWTTEAPEIRSVALTSPLTGSAAAAVPAAESGAANTFNQMGIGGMAGQAMAGPPATDGNHKPVTQARGVNRVTTDNPGDTDVDVTPAPRTVMTGVAAAIRDVARQRAAGLLTEQEYVEQKKQLLRISFGQ